MENVTFFVAFTAGILSFFSPCIFPLIPAYVSQLTGSMVRDNKILVKKRTIFSRSVWFILGFSVVFVAMGASASWVGQFFVTYRDMIGKLGGLLIIIFGLQMAGILQLRMLMLEKSWFGQKLTGRGSGNSFIMGVAFGSGWTPCVGLALSSILLLAGSSNTVYSGVMMLFIYSLGLGLPFLFISLLITYSLNVVKKINRWLPYLSVANGWILVILGLLLFTGHLEKMSSWLAQFTY
ncbi:cytochrome c biogenesis CcdA family protein [Marinicrinis lubricantis]|uniref:Cytochrome c biogenesis CcdA family protein n=1 Tax=Marinicrinis lubricantis TaxID=2086470 RepID=A0ABW1INK5_9BACL